MGKGRYSLGGDSVQELKNTIMMAVNGWLSIKSPEPHKALNADDIVLKLRSGSGRHLVFGSINEVHYRFSEHLKALENESRSRTGFPTVEGFINNEGGRGYSAGREDSV
ncbi:hypothetical protein CEXT_341641 [Caerostris extrusa]|uniref:Uncharacterized protein n=1 Tax=Caerostris extrusa TaxID=172846 RepID=A0AAV4P3A0_CAEEX|nr:hypothetical protein CEXT_341641 [Caerostris extrusa]